MGSRGSYAAIIGMTAASLVSLLIIGNYAAIIGLPAVSFVSLLTIAII